jgi:hypothetical protein
MKSESFLRGCVIGSDKYDRYDSMSFLGALWTWSIGFISRSPLSVCWNYLFVGFPVGLRCSIFMGFLSLAACDFFIWKHSRDNKRGIFQQISHTFSAICLLPNSNSFNPLKTERSGKFVRVLASTVTLVSEPCGTRDCILLSDGSRLESLSHSSYLTRNTLCLRYKAQPVNAV